MNGYGADVPVTELIDRRVFAQVKLGASDWATTAQYGPPMELYPMEKRCPLRFGHFSNRVGKADDEDVGLG